MAEKSLTWMVGKSRFDFILPCINKSLLPHSDETALLTSLWCKDLCVGLEAVKNYSQSQSYFAPTHRKLLKCSPIQMNPKFIQKCIYLILRCQKMLTISKSNSNKCIIPIKEWRANTIKNEITAAWSMIPLPTIWIFRGWRDSLQSWPLVHMPLSISFHTSLNLSRQIISQS